MKTPEQVLRECGIRRPPVPVDEIPAQYGIQLCQLKGADDIFGAIARKRDQVIIALNPVQHPNRQRFTIAHELAHYFLHPNEGDHVDRDFRIILRNSDSSRGVDWKEVEANRFAAALLMPEHFLRRDLTRISEFDEPTVRRLASRYRVSRLAMKYRLQNLGLISPEFAASE